MSNHQNWLKEQAALWVSDGLIAKSQADSIMARYSDADDVAADSEFELTTQNPDSPSETVDPTIGRGVDSRSHSEHSRQGWIQNILSAAGAGIFGLGVILFFAYNWAAFPKILKLAIIFIGVGGFHLGAQFLERVLEKRRLIHQPSKRPLRHSNRVSNTIVESLHVAGTMLFGAGIWLIAQIYHLDEHFPTAFAIWGIAALALAWLLPSVIQGFIAAAAITTWGLSESITFDAHYWYIPALVLLGLGSLAWWLKSRALLFVSLISFLSLVYSFYAMAFDTEFVFFLSFLLASFFMLLSMATRYTDFKNSEKVFLFLGSIPYLCFLFILTAGTLESGYLDGRIFQETRWLLVLYVFSIVAWLVACVIERNTQTPATHYLHYPLVALSLAIIGIQVAGYSSLYFNIQLLLLNAIFALHGVLLILRGSSLPNWRYLSLGSMILLSIVSMRFGDLFDSLMMRSLAFVIFGAALVYIGHRFNKRRQIQGESNA